MRVRLPFKGGREQVGTRPAVLMQVDEGTQKSPTLVIVPLTSQLAAARFGHSVQLEPGEHSGLQMQSVAMVYQLTAVDRVNVVEQLGALSHDEFESIRQAVIQMVTPSA